MRLPLLAMTGGLDCDFVSFTVKVLYSHFLWLNAGQIETIEVCDACFLRNSVRNANIEDQRSE